MEGERIWNSVTRRVFIFVIISIITLCFCVPTNNAANKGCPLDFTTLNFTELTKACSEQNNSKCCHYVHAFVGISLARHANSTNQIGVSSLFADACLSAILNNLQLSGLPPNATACCGLGTKITVNPVCKDLKTIQDMEKLQEFKQVKSSCTRPISSLAECRICLHASIVFLRHHLGEATNLTLSICKDATFVAIASYGEMGFTVDKESCFFGLQGLGSQPVLTRKAKIFVQLLSPAPSPVAKNLPHSVHSDRSFVKHATSTHWILIVGVGVGLTGVILFSFLFLIVLIRRKRKELESSGKSNGFHWKKAFIPKSFMQSQEWRNGQNSMFRQYSYKEIRVATDDFSTTVGREGSGTVYKAQFQDGLVAAVKQMNGRSGQHEDEFCKEMEFLGRLHHRHLVKFRGFCTHPHDRFLVYEYIENRNLKELLHGPSKSSLNWTKRIQIAADVAAALEYLHFYCDPHLCHGDIKSANILLDANFVAKLADLGLPSVSPNDGNNSQTINSDIRGTPGYIDPEYVITQQLTLKSDVYSYGVLLLELITGRNVVHNKISLVDWAQKYIWEESLWAKMIDPCLLNTIQSVELSCIIHIIRMCTQKESKDRPSIKKVHLLCDNLRVSSPDARINE